MADSGSTSSTSLRGLSLLHDPVCNKGTAFTDRERDALGLRGLLPARVHTQPEQVQRVLSNLRGQSSDLEKYIFLTALHDRNETLFFRVVMENAEEIMPLIYTPTVGLGCQLYGRIYRQARGLFVTASDTGRVKQLLQNWPQKAGLIVVTDGERILGLGDLGAQGMGIPVGKLSLYTACAGMDPSLCLPVTLDVGTENEELLNDPLYIGAVRRRLRGAEYDALVDEFVTAATEVFPGVLIQFEDFANANAFRLLHKYQDRICTFNDDIQGTASVALSGLKSAIRITGKSLADTRVLFLGAGEAACGIADLVTASLVAQGLPEPEARKRCWLVDSKGLVTAARQGLTDHKRKYAHEHAPVADFAAAVNALKPQAIIGVAAVGRTFTKPIIEAMSSFNERPIVFALSNPTSKAECTAEEAYAWSKGRAVFACGSPFAPVNFDGKTFVPRQGNNSYIFPGVGLGVVACKAKRVTDEMFLAAADTLAGMVSKEDLDQGSIYPSLSRMREVSAAIATCVADVAFARGLAGVPKPADTANFIRKNMYEPTYPSYA
ncbi:MAG TPA: NAD-dependent malic enzyme [Usitatibacteraceae bacterium]|nr:NAD-dependent malic enzyme [Usitatibacteraceae bacterium]